MSTNPSAQASGGLLRQAATPQAGFALQNATPALFTWNVPSDGQLHRFMLLGELLVTVAQTGGAVVLGYTDPSGGAQTSTVFGGGLGVGAQPVQLGEPITRICRPGSTVTVSQSSAQTAGAATAYLELWGS